MSLDLARRLACRPIRGIVSGSLLLIEDDPPSARMYGSGQPTVTVRVRSPRMWPMLLRGSRGLADAYAEGLWDSDDLVGVLRLAARNLARADRARLRLLPLRRPARRLQALVRPAGKRRNRRDVSAHYDLGNQLFARMLDPTMSYSCALFAHPDMTLEEAQLAKLERICQRLELGPDDRVVEIGSGWGGFALYAARTRGCRVTTTTISRAQYDYTREQVQRVGFGERVQVLMRDYRDLRGRYDKLVSIEMIEAVGWRNLHAYLTRCSQLLQPDGAMLLQAITIDDRLYELEKSSRSFIRTRIFPGGCLPSQEAIARGLDAVTDMRIAGREDLTPHYAQTLRCWRESFTAHAGELGALGYDERFRRLWTLYLAYCEAGFAERRIQDVQLLIAKPGYRGQEDAVLRPYRRRPAARSGMLVGCR